MKTVEFDRLYENDIAMTEIAVIYQTPQWNSIEMKNEGGRRLNGFLLIDKGECLYEWQDKSASLSRGSLIYLPSGSKHTVTVTERPFSFYRISFSLIDPTDGERIIFTNEPCVMTSTASGRLFELANELISSTVLKSRAFKSTSMLAEFFHVLLKSRRRPESRISTAVEHIDRHYSEETNVDGLAALCYISKPHLFRLFKSELGMSPIEYRNHLRMERAKVLLSDGELSVGEIAAMLGFENGYYFSRMFKEHTGMSPSKYGEM